MLNISRQIVAGWDPTSTKYALPEAELVPLGETANEKKRLQKIVNKSSASQEYDNAPIPGFTMYQPDRKNWGSIDQTWLVIDPRGFLGRITSDNLGDILSVTGITEGLIQEKCVWARVDSQTKMMLVPISSPDYIDAVRNTELIETKTSIRDVQIGDTVLMQNEMQGTYLGTLSLYGPFQQVPKNRQEYKPGVALRRQVVEVEPGKFYYNTDAKILKVMAATNKPLTKQQAADHINQHLAAGSAQFSKSTYFTPRYSTYDAVNFASPHAVPKPVISLVEIDRVSASILFRKAMAESDFAQLVLENHNGKHLIDFSYGPTPIVSDKFITVPLVDQFDSNTESILLKQKRQYHMNTVIGNESLDNFTKFYKIVKHVKDTTYI